MYLDEIKQFSENKLNMDNWLFFGSKYALNEFSYNIWKFVWSIFNKINFHLGAVHKLRLQEEGGK